MDRWMDDDADDDYDHFSALQANSNCKSFNKYFCSGYFINFLTG